jgi:hypothetical protein
VTVRLGGRTRRVLALEYLRAGTGSGDAPGHPAPYGDNAERLASRSVILMVNEDTIRPGRTIIICLPGRSRHGSTWCYHAAHALSPGVSHAG